MLALAPVASFPVSIPVFPFLVILLALLLFFYTILISSIECWGTSSFFVYCLSDHISCSHSLLLVILFLSGLSVRYYSTLNLNLIPLAFKSKHAFHNCATGQLEEGFPHQEKERKENKCISKKNPNRNTEYQKGV